MFILMGALVSASGMSRELFRAANAWVGHLPGGMAIATIFACGGFAAINGSSIASAATMTQVALPEMRRAGYDPGLSAGVVAAGGTLGIMIPPSVMFILYAILTDTDLVALFIAGIHPGLIAIVLYCITILLIYWCASPNGCRAASASDWRERWRSLQGRVGDAAARSRGDRRHLSAASSPSPRPPALGVFGALVIGVARGRLPWARDRRQPGRGVAHLGGDLLHPDRRVPVSVLPGGHADVAAAGRLPRSPAGRPAGYRHRRSWPSTSSSACSWTSSR